MLDKSWFIAGYVLRKLGNDRCPENIRLVMENNSDIFTAIGISESEVYNIKQRLIDKHTDEYDINKPIWKYDQYRLTYEEIQDIINIIGRGE